MMKAFSKVAGKREGASSFEFIDAVLRARPDLQGQMTYTPSVGIFGNTVIIGDEVFKGPASKSGVVNFNEEFYTLKRLQGKGLPVPEITWESKDFVFFGMTRVPGVMLGAGFEKRLSLEEKRTLAADLVDFVIGMANAVPQRAGGAFLMHDDLHYENIMIDPKTKRLCGVIDFGIVKYGTKDQWRVHTTLRNGDLGKLMEAEFDRRKSEIQDTFPVKKALQSQALAI